MRRKLHGRVGSSSFPCISSPYYQVWFGPMGPIVNIVLGVNDSSFQRPSNRNASI